jgi:hypothetical protein
MLTVNTLIEIVAMCVLQPNVATAEYLTFVPFCYGEGGEIK